MIVLRLLGPVDIRDASGREIDTLLRRPKRVALLAYLAAAKPHGFHRRDSLTGLFWSETPHEHARHALSQALHVLRQELSEEAIATRGEDVALNRRSVSCDIDAFEQAIAEEHFATALEVYRGDFLAGCYVSDAPEFEHWVDDQRTRLAEAAASAAWKYAYQLVDRRELLEAERSAQLALSLISTEEGEVRKFIETLAHAGDRAAAIRFYERFRDRLAEEYELEPALETQQLVSQIRTRQTPPDQTSFRRPAVSGTSYTWQRPSDVPLVGRSDTYGKAYSIAESSLQTGPLVLVVLGATGMGKTRTLEDCIARFHAGGGMVALARPIASDHDAPFSSLRTVLREGLVDAPGAMATDPRALSVLASIDPVLAGRTEPTNPRDTNDVARALASLLRAVAEEQPIAVALDDAHLSDGRTIEALGEAVRHLVETPVLFLVAVDPTDPGAPCELARFRAGIGRDLQGATVRLDPLALDEMRQIVEFLAGWCKDEEDADRLTRRVYYESGGSPFLATTLLRHLEAAPSIKEDLLTWPARGSTFESPLPISVPDLVRMSVVARVASLEENLVNVLRAASVAGLAVDPQLVSVLAKMDQATVEAALDRLELLGFLRYDGNRYVFAAPILAETVKAEYLTHGQRQRLRRRTANELEGREDLESRVLRVELLARVDRDDGTFEEALAVAQAAMGTDSGRTARRALFAAERAAGDNSDKLQLVQYLRSSTEEKPGN